MKEIVNKFFQSFLVFILGLILSIYLGILFSKNLTSEVITLNMILFAICYLASVIWFATVSIIREIKKQKE